MPGTDLELQRTSSAGFIRAYGLFWHVGEVDWDADESERKFQLLGRNGDKRPKVQLANFWEQQGIYILHNAYGAYYVGRTVGEQMNLGKRLRQHHNGTNGSPHRGKWDRFSWFGWRGTLKSVDDQGLRQLRATPRKLLADSDNTVRDIESLLILALGTTNSGNKRQETFVAAARWEQVRWDQRDQYLSRVAP